MYENFYKLSEKPFSIQPDPSFLFMGREHTLAYRMLEYGVINRAGFVVVTGEIGCGKTTLLRKLLDNLDEDVLVGLINSTHQDVHELLQWVLYAFELDYKGKTRLELYETFQNFLIEEYARGRRCILIIDEAQNMATDTLEELRMLSNINADKDMLIQLILVGQPELRALLNRPELYQLVQRVSVDYHLKPLTSLDTARYIHHRLEVVGRNDPLFTPEACDLVHRATGGVPRLINILCDTALVYAYADERPMVDKETVLYVFQDMAEFESLHFNQLRETISGIVREHAHLLGESG